MRLTPSLGLVAALAVGATLASAAGHSDPNAAAVKARQSHMTLYSHNLGPLGGMARGNMDYDAERAQEAADNLAALVSMSQTGYWLPGTDSDSVEGSRALPAIWADGSTVGEKGAALRDAVMTLQGEAGNGLEALQAAMGPVGQACGSCHDDYRLSDS